MFVLVNYEQSRLEYFRNELKRAERRLKWAVDRQYFDECSDRGAEVSYLTDVVKMLEQEEKVAE